MSISQRLPEQGLLPKVLATYGLDGGDESKQRQFVAEHIAQLESSDNEAIARSGFVLNRAQEGFGLGHKVPLAIIAMGQTMLGIDLAVATPFLASNPAAFTAAALGAVYYGYQALEDSERAELHARIGAALEFGVELVKTIARFCIETMKSILDPETLSQIKRFVAEVAEAAGGTLYDVTGKFLDRISGVASSIGTTAASAGSSIGSAAASTVNRGKRIIWRNDEVEK